MPRWLVRLLALATVVSGASIAFAFSTGPPASKTGAPAVGGVVGEGICTECHSSFPLNTPGATVEILDVPTFYDPDTLYTLRVRMTSTFAPPRRWGFQITAVRAADGQGAGTFDITGITGIQVINGAGAFASRRYVEHSTNTFQGNVGPVEWTLRWRAPSTNVGRILFFAAGNAANNSGTNTGDHIYTTRDTTDINPLVGVPVATDALDLLDSPYPNPFRSHTRVGYVLSRGGAGELTVFDLQGRRVRSLVRGTLSPGPGAAIWDGRSDAGAAAAAGVYLVRLSAPGVQLSRRIVLTR